MYVTWNYEHGNYNLNLANPLKEVMVTIINNIVLSNEYDKLNNMVKKNNTNTKYLKNIASINNTIEKD